MRSQHQRMVGRDLWKLYNPNPCSEQGRLEQVGQSCVQAAFEYLQGWTLHGLSGKPVPVSNRSHSKKDFYI